MIGQSGFLDKYRIDREKFLACGLEDGWSEIDHRIRYPYDVDNPILSQYLFIFNRLAGSADEMASFVRLLKSNFEEKDRAIKELREQVEQHSCLDL